MFISVRFSCSVMSDSLPPHGLQHARLPCLSPTPGAYLNSCPSSQWCHPTISSSVVPFSSSPQSILPSIRIFSKELPLCIWHKSIGASVSVLPVNIKDLFPLGLTGWIFFCPKDSQESSPTPQFEKYQFFSAQPFLWPNSHIHNMTTVKSIALTIWTFVGKVMSAF